MKALKKLVSTILAGAMFMTSVASAVFAEEISIETSSPEIGELCENGLYLISETETVLEDGTVVRDRYYSDVADDSISPLSVPNSGSRTVRHEKDFVEAGELVIVVWAQAKFTWNTSADTVTISNVDYDQINYSDATITDKIPDYNSNQGRTGWGGYKYAYLRYTVKLTNRLFTTREYSVYIDLNVIGIATRS